MRVPLDAALFRRNRGRREDFPLSKLLFFFLNLDSRGVPLHFRDIFLRERN